jgi:hypothetical protein
MVWLKGVIMFNSELTSEIREFRADVGRNGQRAVLTVRSRSGVYLTRQLQLEGYTVYSVNETAQEEVAA